MTSTNETTQAIQREIDAITWYHEFDFGNGLRATTTSDTQLHRQIWKFIEAQLDKIDFENRTVLDIGCWDGYWSFYAERRGAKRVLATDDMTQNWANGAGLRLAKRLLKSNIEINQSVSIYEASKLGETFDIVLCLGVYYHLIDPFAAFAQVRHCLHAGSTAVFEGDVTHALRPDCYYWDPRDPYKPVFIPTAFGLKQ
ncbi:MAG: tRNA 5-methoxyuridine(34)/uridine 5-oxyacetic acid(34) synthase CmoB, partial [Methylocystis sp.]|nr:tRNA 5-methoxyuridine(34)/uridine 5-oxyacetic acid(34) synthase CmoB [Methylocystis sp.]